MDKIVGKVKKQIEKAKIKRYFKKLIEILSLKELRILPAYLAYSFVLAVVPIDRKSTRLNSSHTDSSRMPSSA